jgi:CRP/FNR family transcriptional regulator
MKMQIAVKNTACGVSCSQCSLSEICLPSGLDAQQLLQLEGLIQHKRKVRRSEHLFRANDALQSLYAIRSGFFKTYVLHEDGRAQVTGFQLAGEILGMDAISGDAHACHAVALEDSEVCVIPFARLEQLGRELPALQRHLHRLMSREIVRDHGVMLLLGAMRAEERLVTLLLNLSRRYLARGYSGSEFQLRMTREEIGSFLGLKLETVSRAFSKLQQDGLIDVQNKAVQLRDLAALKGFIGKSERPATRIARNDNVFYGSF